MTNSADTNSSTDSCVSTLCREHWTEASYSRETIVPGHHLARLNRAANGLHIILRLLANSHDAEAIQNVDPEHDPAIRRLSPAVEGGLFDAALELAGGLVELAESHEVAPGGTEE